MLGKKKEVRNKRVWSHQLKKKNNQKPKLAKAVDVRSKTVFSLGGGKEVNMIGDAGMLAMWLLFLQIMMLATMHVHLGPRMCAFFYM
jgi:hypothetical protein